MIYKSILNEKKEKKNNRSHIIHTAQMKEHIRASFHPIDFFETHPLISHPVPWLAVKVTQIMS